MASREEILADFQVNTINHVTIMSVITVSDDMTQILSIWKVFFIM